MSIVWRWLRYLGFKYDTNKRSCFVDGCERKYVVKDRNERFLVHYFKAECRARCWIQIESILAVDIELKNPTFPKNCSYDYTVGEGNSSATWREYHVDMHPLLEKCIHPINKGYGGNLSVRLVKDSRPLMLVGEGKII